MKFTVYVTGEFINVLGVSIDQSYPIRIKCTNCGKVHEKTVVLSIESHKVGEEAEKANLTVTCKECRRVMSFIISRPEELKKHLLPTNHEGETKEMWFAYEEQSRFVVSTITTANAEVISAGPCELSVISIDKVVFNNVDIEDKAVAECNNLKKISSIVNLRFEVEQTK
jgi:hypothetical protein